MAISRTHGMHVGKNSAGRWVVWDNAGDASRHVLSPDFATKREAVAYKRRLASRS